MVLISIPALPTALLDKLSALPSLTITPRAAIAQSTMLPQAQFKLAALSQGVKSQQDLIQASLDPHNTAMLPQVMELQPADRTAQEELG